MHRLSLAIALLCISFATLASDRIVYVTNPDLTKYTMTWIGRDPQCHETNVYGDTYGWIYHAIERNPITVLIKSKLLNNAVCTILISDFIKGNNFPSVAGSGCYFVKSNGSEKINFGSAYTTWITTNDAVPYQSHACGN